MIRTEALHARLLTLLNTRPLRPDLAETSAFPRAARSFLTWGMEDVIGCSPGHPATRARLARALHRALQMFEPSLDPVRIQPAPFLPGQPLTFRVEARCQGHLLVMKLAVRTGEGAWELRP